MGRNEAGLEPFPDRADNLGDALRAVEAPRRTYLIGPAQARLPALVGQLLRRRSKRVRHGIPDVAPAIAVEIDGVAVEFRRQELGEPHRAAPGAAHVGKAHLPFLQHFQRQQELVLEHLLTLADISLGREHPDRIVRQPVGAKIGLAAPDRQQHVARHPELLFDRLERRAILLAQLRAARRKPGNGRLLEIIGRGLDKLRLAALRRLGTARNGEIGQAIVGLKAAGRRVEGRPGDPDRLRPRPHSAEPLLEVGVGRSQGSGAKEREKRSDR